MHHLKASNLLTHYLSGDLDSGQRKEIEAHLAQCAECAGWVATCSLFAEVLGDHLASTEIASFSLQPEALDPATCERCAEHLERCRECQRTAELVREAAAAARPEPVRRRTWGGLAPRWAASAALAATVVLALGAIFASGPAPRLPAEYVLAGSTLRGNQTILADQSIVVEATEVAPGAALTLESEVVAFGSGFAVKSGATLTVVNRESAAEEVTSEGP